MENFEGWAIVELFGHKKIAGKVSEQDVAGAGFVRIDVPAVNGHQPFTKLLGTKSIYAIIPVDEAHAVAAAQAWDPQPLDPYDIEQLARSMARRMASQDRQLGYDEICDELARSMGTRMVTEDIQLGYNRENNNDD